MVSLLLERGADTEARDHDRRTPLLWAGRTAVMALLLDAGADIDARGNGGTLLQQLVYATGIAEFLLDRGADVSGLDCSEGSLIRRQYAGTPLLARLCPS